ncbi:lipase family protein [Chitinophaga sp. G-6-1-13]|uniref:Lipase family protein n=1 Tax=Chitinophaga fulva TaxID=2728842 RepID=A0A848GIQ0_9BACT|nr:lipase family protein [Chitinophaga fulva]NML36783.1 lipase family protein [Chitinophaga fulva]
METQIKPSSVSLSEAVQYAKIVNLADILYKQAVANKDKATQLNPSLKAYQNILDDTEFQALVDTDFLTNYYLLYNIQMNDIIIPGNKDQVYYGFIAQNKSSKEYVMAIRGTENLLEALADAFFVPKAFNEFNNGAQVPSGFYDLYESGLLVSPPDSELQIVPVLLNIVAADPSLVMPDAQKVRTVVAGHSLGASLATYFAAAASVGMGKGMDLCVYTYASPISGDATFANTYNSSVGENHRIHNAPDVVPGLPIYLQNGTNIYIQVAGGYQIDSTKYSLVKTGAGCAHQLPVYQYVLENLNGTDDPSIMEEYNSGACKA